MRSKVYRLKTEIKQDFQAGLIYLIFFPDDNSRPGNIKVGTNWHCFGFLFLGYCYNSIFVYVVASMEYFGSGEPVGYARARMQAVAAQENKADKPARVDTRTVLPS